MANHAEEHGPSQPPEAIGVDRFHAAADMRRLQRVPGDARARALGAYEIPRRGVRHRRNVDVDVAEAALEIAAVIHERCKILRIGTPVYADVEAALARLRKAGVPALDRRQPNVAP